MKRLFVVGMRQQLFAVDDSCLVAVADVPPLDDDDADGFKTVTMANYIYM